MLIVRDEEHCHLHAVAKLQEEFEHLRLNRDVERGDGFVADEKRGFERHGAGDGRALELAARHDGRTPAGVVRGKACGPEHFERGLRGRLLREAPVVAKRFGHLLDDRKTRIEAGVWVLMDHLHGGALGAPGGGVSPGDRRVLEAHCAFGGLDEAEREARERRFAAARFAHESHDLARADLQVDVLQDVPGTAAAEKALPRDVAVAGDADIGDDGKLGVLNGQGRKARGARRRMRGGGEERGVAAGAPAAVLDGRHGAETFAAGVRDARAARGEGTARAELVGRRNLALDRDEPAAGAVHGGHGPQKAFGVGMGGTRDDVGDGAFLKDVARVHDGDVVGDVAGEVQVVRDDEHRHAARLHERTHFLQELPLHDDVERRGGFVGEEQPGAAREGERDHHALAHAARELVGVGVHALFGRGDADGAQKLERNVVAVGA